MLARRGRVGPGAGCADGAARPARAAAAAAALPDARVDHARIAPRSGRGGGARARPRARPATARCPPQNGRPLATLTLFRRREIFGVAHGACARRPGRRPSGGGVWRSGRAAATQPGSERPPAGLVPVRDSRPGRPITTGAAPNEGGRVRRGAPRGAGRAASRAGGEAWPPQSVQCSVDTWVGRLGRQTAACGRPPRRRGRRGAKGALVPVLQPFPLRHRVWLSRL